MSLQIEMKLNAVSKELEEIKTKLATAGRQRVVFPVQKTGAGIELQAGTTVEAMGYIVAVNMIPTGPNQLSPFFIIKQDGTDIPVIAQVVKFID